MTTSSLSTRVVRALRFHSNHARLGALTFSILFAGCIAAIDDGSSDPESLALAVEEEEPEFVDDLVQDPIEEEESFWAADLSGVTGANWMSGVPSSVRLSELSIPGTHDSMAFFEPVAGTAKCQNLRLMDQLNAGVRFLDIRCRHFGDSFTIHHGPIYQNANFDDVLNTVFAFLKANPSEAVILSVKEEHTAANNTRSFEQTFDAYVAKNPGKWNMATTIPTLQAARGKITLFRRFGGANRGINAASWPDKTTFSSGPLRVQDVYAVSSTQTKWNQINALFDEALSGSSDTLYVNYTSGTATIIFVPNVPVVANPINQKLNSYFSKAGPGRYGIVVMDFVTASLASKIYNKN